MRLSEGWVPLTDAGGLGGGGERGKHPAIAPTLNKKRGRDLSVPLRR